MQVENVTADGPLTLTDVKSSRTVHRLWTAGQDSAKYFLLENRQRPGYDAELPGDGLLVWHVDDSRTDNSDENHHLVRLLQADGLLELEQDLNRGDGGDCYPGWNGNTLRTGQRRRPPSRTPLRTPGSWSRGSPTPGSR